MDHDAGWTPRKGDFVTGPTGNLGVVMRTRMSGTVDVRFRMAGFTSTDMPAAHLEPADPTREKARLLLAEIL